jgi:hypothetical protein
MDPNINSKRHINNKYIDYNNKSAPGLYSNNQPQFNNPPIQNFNQFQYQQQPGVYTPNQQLDPNQQIMYNQMNPNQQIMYNQMNPNQQIMYNQMNMQNLIKRSDDPLEELRNAKSAIIKQKFEIFEVMTGCETVNRYYVYAKDPKTDDKNILFKCKEESGFCMRTCCR